MVVDVPGGEAARAIAVDRPDVLAIDADVSDPLGRLREGDAYVELWLHRGELDSVVLDPRTRATEGREQRVVEPTQSGSGETWQLRGYT